MVNILKKLPDALRAAAGLLTPDNCFVSAVIVAGGSGSRMGNMPRTKQLTEIGGIPVIVRTLLAFQSCTQVDEIIVAARKDELSLYEDFKKKYGITKLVHAVAGGDTRRESVLNGISVISGDSEYVAIHDGARCLITPDMILSVLKKACACGAAAAAERMTDTVKRCDENGFITDTLDRADLWRAQTPQAFKTSLYLASAYTAEAEGFEATDDCMLAEHLGFKVGLVDCGRENMKITTREDLIIAKAILDSRCIRETEKEIDGISGSGKRRKRGQ